MAITRIKNNQVTDLTLTNAKIAGNTITGAKLAANLTYGSNLTITGNLDVNGTTTTVDSTNTTINDPLIVLSANATGVPSVDAGIVVERGSTINAAWIFDETNDEWAAITTTDNGSTNGAINKTAYANIQVANIITSATSMGNIQITGNTITATNLNGGIILDPNGTGTVQIDAAAIIGGNIDGTIIGATTAAAGTFTSVVGTSGNFGAGTLAAGATTIASLTGSGDVNIGTGKFTVAAVSGNTAVAGTLGVTGTSTLGTVNAGATTLTGAFGGTSGTFSTTLGVTGLATFTAGADMTGDKIVNVADPTLAQDAATKAYVDSISAAGWSITDSVTTQVIQGGDTLTIQGTVNEVDVAVTAIDTLTIGLPSNVTITNNLAITGDITGVTGITSTGNWSTSGTVGTGALTAASAIINGATQVNGTLGVTGTATMATVNGTVGSFSSTLGVTGAATFSDDITMLGGVAIDFVIEDGAAGQTFSVASTTGNTIVGGTLNVTGTSTLAAVNSGNLFATGTIGSTSDADFGGTVTSSGNFDVAVNKFTVDAVSGNTTVAGTLGVTGHTSVSTITSTGLGTFDSASVTNNIAAGSLNVTGISTLGVVNAGVTGTTTITSTGAGNIGTTLDVGTNLTVSGSSTLVGAVGTGALTASSVTDSSLTAGRITYAGTAGDLSDSANLTYVSGTGTVGITGALDIDNITIDGNTISSTDLNGNIVLAPNGTGVVNMSSSVIQGVSTPVLATDAANKSYVDSVASTGFTLTDGSTPQTISGGDTVTVNGTANEVTAVTSATDTLTIGLPSNVTVANDLTVTNDLTVNGTTSSLNTNVTITGNLTVQGTTTTVESTVSVVADPIMAIGTVAAPPSIDNGKDAGIQWDYFNGTAKVGFFGWDNSSNTFTFIPDATIVSEVVSGAAGNFALGSMTLSSLTNNRVLLAGVGGVIEDSANFTFDGLDLNLTGGLNVVGDIVIDNIAIDGNTMISTDTNGAINLTPNGTGAVVISNVDIAAGAIDGTPIGATVASTGAFTSVTASTTLGVTGLANLDGGIAVDTTNFTVNGTTGAVSTASTLNASGIATFGDDILMTGGAGITFDIENGLAGNVFSVDSTNGNTVIAGTLGAGATSVTTLGSSGLATLDSLLVSNNATVTGTLDVTGAFAINTNKFTVDDVTGNTLVAGTMGITGNTSITGTLGAGASTLASATITGNLTNVGGTSQFTGLATFVAGADMTGDKIINVADPTAAQDAATKAYVDAVASGGWTVSDSTNTSVISGGDTLTVAGTANEVNVAVGAGLDTLTIGLTDSVVITTNLTATGGATQVAGFTATNSQINGTLGVTGTATMAAVNGTNIAASGTLGAGGILTASDDIRMVGGLGVDFIIEDGAAGQTFSVASTTGNTIVGGTLTAGNTGVGTLSTSGLATLASASVTASLGVGTTLTVGGLSTLAAVDASGSGTFASLSTDVGGISSQTTISSLGNASFGGTTTSTGSFDVNTTMFTVDAVNGNTLVAGTLGVTGAGSFTSTLSAAGITDSNLSATQVTYAGTGGLLSGDPNFTFNDTTDTLTVTGIAQFDAVTIDGNDITVNTGSELSFNEAGGDFNLRVEGTTDVNLLFIDAGQNNIGIGTATPNSQAKLHISSTDSIIIPVGTTAQRPTTPATGMYRWNTTLGSQEIYDGTTWISGVQFTVISSDAFAGDDTTTVFTLAEASTSSGAIVSINGVVQIPGTAYGISGTTLTFTSAPATGDSIDVRVLTTSSTVTKMTGTGGTIDVEANAAGIEITGAFISKATGTSVGTTATTIATFDGSLYRGAKYLVTVTNGTDHQISEVICVHDGVVASQTEYGIIWTNASLGSTSINYNAGTIELQYTGMAVGNTVKVQELMLMEV